MPVAIRPKGVYEEQMPQQDVLELEAQLIIAREAVEKLTKANAELTAQLAEAERMLKKSRRNSRRDESGLRSQISDLQNRRG